MPEVGLKKILYFTEIVTVVIWSVLIKKNLTYNDHRPTINR